MKTGRSRPGVAAAALVVAGLCAVTIDDGWLLAVPVVLAVAVAVRLAQRTW